MKVTVNTRSSARDAKARKKIERLRRRIKLLESDVDGLMKEVAESDSAVRLLATTAAERIKRLELAGNMLSRAYPKAY